MKKLIWLLPVTAGIMWGSIGAFYAGKVSILAAGEPVAAMVFGIFFFSEAPTPLEFVGMAITVAAIILLGMPERKRAPIRETLPDR